jgi:hypothetical protein
MVLILASLGLLFYKFYQPTNSKNEQSGQLKAGGHLVQPITITSAKNLRLEVTTDNPDAQVTLRDPDGATSELIGGQNELTKIFNLIQPTSGRDWQVEINNPSASALNYNIKTPVNAGNPSPLAVSPTIDQESGQTVGISITVTETILSVTTPITGAQVVAYITSPSGEVTMIILQEVDPINNPGVYTGEFDGGDESGVYQIEYVIDGQNSAGEPIVQTSTGQFEVNPGNQTTPSYSKKYDINRGDEVQIIGY